MKRFALIIALLVCLVPAVGWAGDLTPSYGALTNLYTAGAEPHIGGSTNGVTVAISGAAPVWVGTIDASAYYFVDVWANVYEESTTATAQPIGVSIYALPSSTGVTLVNKAPTSVIEISAAEYTAAAATAGRGVTKFLGTYELMPYLGFQSSSQSSADKWSIQIRYKLGKGAY